MALTSLLVAAVVMTWPRLSRSFRPRSRSRTVGSDLDLAARLLLIAVSSGLPLSAAVERIVPELHGPVGVTIAEVARRARLQGVARALLAAPASLRPLSPMLARAHLSGASVTGALEAFLQQRRRAVIGEATSRARRAGIVLVIPLALLLLPGFGLVVFGPYVAGHLRGLVLGP